MRKAKHKTMKVCFFAHDKNIIEDTIIEFYSNDIKILKKLGFEIIIAKKFAEIPWDVDCYYAWWFGWGFLPLLVAKLNGKPHFCCGNVHTLADDGRCEGLSRLPLLQRIVMKLTMKMSDKTLLTSKEELKRLGNFRPKNVSVVYHGIDFNNYHPTSGQRTPCVVSVTLLSVANIMRKKLLQCIDAFAKVAPKYPTIFYKIVGSKGDGIEILENHIRSLGLEKRILLCGEVNREEKIKLLQEAMIYLQLTDCEGFGLAIVEAMACRTPVITSPEAAVREVVGNSVLYARSVEEAAQHINKLLEDPEYWTEYADRALKKAKEYDISIRLEKFRSIFKQFGLL